MKINFPADLQQTAKNELARIAKQMKGRPCYTSYLHLVYMLREWMGDKCKYYCEMGTLFGGSMILAMQSQYPCKFVGVDMFNYYGKEIDPISKTKVNIETTRNNIEKLNTHKHPYCLIKGNSHDKKIQQMIINELPYIDMFFIDGDHSKDGVLADWGMYSPMVSSGGIVIFDNYKDKNWMGVTKAVDTIDFSGWKDLGEIERSIIFQKELFLDQ